MRVLPIPNRSPCLPKSHLGRGEFTETKELVGLCPGAMFRMHGRYHEVMKDGDRWRA